MTPTATRASEPMIAELDQEAAATRRLLERIPAGRLTWKPHPRSLTLGQLALHVAACPDITGFLEMDGLDVSTVSFAPPQPESPEAILTAFEASLAAARLRLAALDDQRAGEPWKLHRAGTEIFTMPKLALMRSLVFNHLYHHRGQLTVYLRLLDVPLPATYGRSADEDPFA